MAVRNNTMRSALAASKPGNRKEARRLWNLAFGDALVFIIFAVIGRQSHGEDAGLGAAGQVIWTALPFLLSWFLISPFIGAYRRELMADPKKMVRATFLSWIAAWPLALVLHFLFNRELPSVSTVVTFGLVTLISNSVLLSVWRVPFAITNETKDREAAAAASREK
jgi:hypothetical protein